MAQKVSQEPRVTTQAHLPYSIRQRLASVAKASGQSLSAVITLAVTKHLDGAGA
jgi:hypothetical protein